MSKDNVRFLIPSLLVIFFIWLRFEYPLPVLFLDDSVKYFIPLPVIKAEAFTWILDTLNISLLQRIFAYFVQINTQGDLTNLIVIQKLLNVASSLLVYFMAMRVSKGRLALSVIVAALFSLNPQLLYLENTVMPESLFLFFCVLSSFFLLELLQAATMKTKSIYAVAFALSMTLAEFAKETGGVFFKVVLLCFFIAAILSLVFKKNTQIFKIFIVMLVASFAARLPMMIYNFDHHDKFTVRRFNSSRGVLLWTLTEDYFDGTNEPKKYPWITKAIKELTLRNRRNFGLAPNAGDERSFFNAISQINSAGRVGSIVDPVTGKKISSKEWSKICTEYWLEASLKNPIKTLRRIIFYSGRRVMTEPNLNLHFYRHSSNPAVNLEAIPYTIAPFSLVAKQDPALSKYKLVKINNLTEKDFEIFHPDRKTSPLQKHFLLMTSRGSEYAYMIPEKGLSLWLQTYLRFVPFAYFIVPVFLYFLILFLIDSFKRLKACLVSKANLLNLFDTDTLLKIYLSVAAFIFMSLPILISSGEPRYRLQFLPYMLIFIAASFYRKPK